MFSQEYIDFILNDGQCLQKLWKFGNYNIGDCVWINGRVGVVAALDSRDYFSDEGVRVFAIFFERPDVPLGDPKPEVWQRHSLAWLPSLRQLLQIIEGAGYVVKLTTLVRRDGTLRYHIEAADYKAEDYIDEIESDLMLAAAKLAEGAINGE
jgi:hypothetical protein